MVRFKNRYLLCEVVWEDGRIDESVSSNTVYHAVRDALIRHFGDWGLACVLQSFQVKYYNHLTNLCIIRSGRDHHKMVWSAVSFVGTMKGRACHFRSVHLGGTIRSCQSAALQHNRTLLLALANAANAATAGAPLLPPPRAPALAAAAAGAGTGAAPAAASASAAADQKHAGAAKGGAAAAAAALAAASITLHAVPGGGAAGGPKGGAGGSGAAPKGHVTLKRKAADVLRATESELNALEP